MPHIFDPNLLKNGRNVATYTTPYTLFEDAPAQGGGMTYAHNACVAGECQCEGIVCCAVCGSALCISHACFSSSRYTCALHLDTPLHTEGSCEHDQCGMILDADDLAQNVSDLMEAMLHPDGLVFDAEGLVCEFQGFGSSSFSVPNLPPDPNEGPRQEDPCVETSPRGCSMSNEAREGRNPVCATHTPAEYEQKECAVTKKDPSEPLQREVSPTQLPTTQSNPPDTAAHDEPEKAKRPLSLASKMLMMIGKDPSWRTRTI